MSWVPVLDGDRRVVGTLSLSDLMRAYRRELLASVARVSDLDPGERRLRSDDHGRLAGGGQEAARRRPAEGVIVTSITRGGEVVLPSGDTVIAAGDRLSLLGKEAGLDAFGEVTPLGPGSR